MAREIVLDTETTGFEPRDGHRLVELACLEIEDLIPTGRTFHCYIDPLRDMPPEAEKVHGLSADFLRGKPRFEAAEVVEAFLDFVGEAPIVAHNAAFDRTFINFELALCSRVEIPEHRWVDTLALARVRFPGMANSLDALCRRFRIPLTDRERHGALIDARLLADVYLELKGGRERRLELAPTMVAQAAGPARPGTYGPRPRPLPAAVSATELERHTAFVREVVRSDLLWKKHGL